MAREGCNLDQDEAEVLKLKSSTSSPSALSPLLSSLPPVFLNSHQEICPEIFERSEAPADGAEPDEQSQPSVCTGIRCSACRKRVRLSGFRCRCGDLFCSRHRYSETHDCSFDYKAAGREEIYKANPLVRPPKILKI